jgi:hypothetical protein
MLRDQMITFLQTAVVFLLLTNLTSAAAAIYVLRSNAKPAHSDSKSAIERNLETILRRAG